MTKLMNTASNKQISLKVVDGVSILDLKDGRVFANAGVSVARYLQSRVAGHTFLAANYVRKYGERFWVLDDARHGADGEEADLKVNAIKRLAENAKSLNVHYWGKEAQDLSGSEWVSELVGLGLVSVI